MTDKMTNALPDGSEERKTYPLYRGLLCYFPRALAAIAHHSFEGSKKHNNPDEPMHWARGKSSDHPDCLLRHVLEGDWVSAAWRALAQLELSLEADALMDVETSCESAWQALDARGLARPDFTVYLCGPITGQKVDYFWRRAAAAYLSAHGIRILDPLRGKDPDQISNQGLGYRGQLASPEIADRDRLDIEASDLILAHFPYEPPRQSIGSLMEMGAAAIGFRKPVLLCTTIPIFNDHLFCRNFCTLEPNFQLALELIVAEAEARFKRR